MPCTSTNSVGPRRSIDVSRGSTGSTVRLPSVGTVTAIEVVLVPVLVAPVGGGLTVTGSTVAAVPTPLTSRAAPAARPLLAMISPICPSLVRSS